MGKYLLSRAYKNDENKGLILANIAYIYLYEDTLK